MKKLIVLLTTALLIASLTACGSKDDDTKEETKQVEKEKDKEKEKEEPKTVEDKYEDYDSASYTLELNGMVSKVVLYYKNDRVYAQTLLTEGPYSAFGVSSKEEAEALMGPIAEKYQGIDGLTHEIVFEEDGLTEVLSIDYENVDLSNLSDVTGAIYDDNAKANGIGFKVTEQAFLDIGYVKD